MLHLLALLIQLAPPDTAGDLTPRQVYQRPDQDGRRVSIFGYLVNGRCLYQSQSRWGEWVRQFRRNADSFDPGLFDEDGVTVLGPDRLLSVSHRLNGRQATVRGRLVARYLDGHRIDPHACGAAAIVIDDAELDRLLVSSGGRFAPGHVRRGGALPR